jgi:hypothetical protein
VAHLGVPGLCYGCDGSGVQQWLSVEKAIEMRSKEIERCQAEIVEKAAWVKAKMETTRSEILRARAAEELEGLRDFYRSNVAELKSPKVSGRWIPGRRVVSK